MAPTCLNYLSRVEREFQKCGKLSYRSSSEHPFDYILCFKREIRWTCFNVFAECSIVTASAFSFFLAPFVLSTRPTSIPLNLLSLSLSLSIRFLSFPSLGLLRSLAICKPPSFTGIGGTRTCYVTLPRMYANHAYMHGT